MTDRRSLLGYDAKDLLRESRSIVEAEQSRVETMGRLCDALERLIDYSQKLEDENEELMASRGLRKQVTFSGVVNNYGTLLGDVREEVCAV